jgi:hypothetical protein
MTVGIGLLCDGGRHIHLTADMRASCGGVSQNDQTGKLFDLPFNFCGAIAGTIGWCGEVISELHWRMSKIPEAQLGAEKIREAILDSYTRIYLMLADQELRNRLKITLHQYHHDKKLVPGMRLAADELLRTIRVDVDLIVAGFIKAGPIQFVARGGTSVKIHPKVTPGNAVIGSGATAAMNWLNYRKQNYGCGLAHSLLHLTEAKQFAEVEPTVGPLRQIALLWPGGWKGLEGGDAMLQEWWNKYGLPLSDGLEQEKYNQSVRETFGLAN